MEETASYLDGPGRAESKKLERNAALAYATESMRLTTRLMQLASWLLLHRAVKEGEMSLAQANKEKAKVKLSSVRASDEQAVKLLPGEAAGADRPLEPAGSQGAPPRRHDSCRSCARRRRPDGNPVERQIGLLKAAFEQDAV